MFFNSEKLLIYLKRSSLEVYFPDSEEGPAILEFPPEAVSHLEILDSATFEKLVTDFLSQFEPKKYEAILVLSQNIYFEKIIKKEEGVEISASEVNKFFENIPFEDFKVRKKVVDIEDNICLYATNKQVYEDLIKVLNQFEFKVNYVVPMGLFFDIPSSQKLDFETVDQISKNQALLKLANFLEETDKRSEEEGSPRKSITIVVVLLALVLLVSLVFAGITFKLIMKLIHLF